MLQHISCVPTSGKSSTFLNEICQASTGAQHLYTLEHIWIYMGLFIIWIPVDYSQHSWFSQVVDTFLYGGPPAWAHYEIIFERVHFPHTWQELPPEAKVCNFPDLPVNGRQGSSQDRDPSYPATLPPSTAPSVAISQLWGCPGCSSSTAYIYSRTLNLWLFLSPSINMKFSCQMKNMIENGRSNSESTKITWLQYLQQ